MLNRGRLVHDIDDRREAGYGVWYTQKKPLNAAALEWRRANKKAKDIGLSEPQLDNHTAWSRILSLATTIINECQANVKRFCPILGLGKV